MPRKQRKNNVITVLILFTKRKMSIFYAKKHLFPCFFDLCQEEGGRSNAKDISDHKFYTIFAGTIISHSISSNNPARFHVTKRKSDASKQSTYLAF